MLVLESDPYVDNYVRLFPKPEESNEILPFSEHDMVIWVQRIQGGKVKWAFDGPLTIGVVRRLVDIQLGLVKPKPEG